MGERSGELPDDLPTESVIGAGCALITAIHGVERTGINWQDTVVVQGAGPVGIALSEADDATRAKVVPAVRAAFSPFVGPDGTARFAVALWRVRAIA